MTSDAADRARSALQALWNQQRPDILARVDALGAAIDAISAGGGRERRLDAEREAHRLAGFVGSFGFTEASRFARQLELLLGSDAPLDPPGMRGASQLVRALRAELSRPQTAAPIDGPVPGAGSPYLLVMDPDVEAGDAIVEAAVARGLRAQVTGDLEVDEEILRERPPGVVVLAAHDTSGWPGMRELVGRLSHGTPPVPVLVVTSSAAFADRLAVVGAGARAVLAPTMSSAEIVELACSILEREQRGSGSLLVVDDDPHFLALVETLLSAEGLRVNTLDDPRRFWQELEDVRPDLVLLDVDMPHVTGTELVRVLRADPRWAGMPVIVLTAHSEPAAVHEAFAAGADDYVAKPIVGPELTTRITNRLERVRLYRALADKDPLTGLANRRKFSEELARLMRMADRYEQPLGFVMIDVDRFKQVNDRYGHAIGDEVLQRLGQSLTRVFRGEDVVARWGGEEFALVLFGMGKADGVQRVAEMLEGFRRETFLSPDGGHFKVTFSAGVAQFPDDGRDVHLLYQAADQALFQAKSAGRNRVLAAP